MRIVMDGVGGGVMHVVCGLPPSHVNASEEVADDDADAIVDGEGAGYGSVAYVMVGQGYVLEVEANEYGCCGVEDEGLH